MNDAFYKPSLNVGSFIGENSSVDTERFLLFMQAYYEWMQSTELTLTSKTGTFTVGETVVGATSGATATVREVKTNSIIIKLVTRTLFNYGEIVNGQSSSATATVGTIKDNVGRASGNVINYKTLESSVDKYVDYLREELYPSIPATYYGDKRLVAQYFKDFYESKSNEQSYRFLFKLLYNEDIEFYYPGEDVLRVSDGNFEKTQIIRTVAIATGIDSLGASYDRDIFLFLNKTIRGKTSGFLANVVDIKKFFIGSREVAEMTLKLVSGTFTAGEDIVDIDDENLVTTVYGIVSGVTIIDGGSGYEDGDIITITGDGSEAQAKVSSIKESPISALTVNTIGHGYQLNTTATINNTGTGGSGFIVKVTELANTYSVTSGANTYTLGEISTVSIINRGEGYFKKPSITLQDTTISSLGLLSDKLITINNAGSNYGVGNTLVFTGGAGANAAGQIASVVETTTYDLLFEDGQQMLMDGSYDDIIKNEDWAVLGPIKRIELTNFGSGYSSANLPSITISTTTGSSANLIATNVQGKNANVTVDTSNNITGIGSIRAVEITNFGINYSAANASASAVGDGNAILSPVISGLGIKEGVWLDDDGKVDYKILQDSYYYQDYSYVIKSGLTFQTYSNTLKSIIHPAGLVYFGEIQILNNLSVPAELINNEEIQRIMISIFANLTVGGQFEYSSVRWTIKVEAPVISLNTNLLDVQEYVIHLVPEGDEVTGITDVGGVVNEGTAGHSFVIQTPFEINATATSATLPTTKFVIGHVDTLPGYGYNTYGDLPMTPFGVYSEDWSVVPISYLQGVRFSDLYGENPAYQTIYTLIDKNPPVVNIGISDTQYQEYVPIISSLGFMNFVTEAFVTTSSITPQKYTAAENIIALYELVLRDASISDIVNETFNSVTPQSLYDSTSTIFADLTFDGVYKNYPNVSRQYNKIITPSTVDSSSLSTSENIVVSYIASGFKYRTYGEVSLSEFESVVIGDISSYGFETYYDTFDDVTIKASPSPFISGQASAPAREDIFRSKYSRQINSNANSIVDFDTGSVTKYNIIDGTIFSANAGFSTLPISTFSSTPVSYLGESLLSDLAPLVIGGAPGLTQPSQNLSGTNSNTGFFFYGWGDEPSSDDLTFGSIQVGWTVVGQPTWVVTAVGDGSTNYNVTISGGEFTSGGTYRFTGTIIGGTDFVTDFSIGDVFLANNENFTVESIANTTYMVTDRLPASTFTNVFAYKQSV